MARAGGKAWTSNGKRRVRALLMAAALPGVGGVVSAACRAAWHSVAFYGVSLALNGGHGDDGVKMGIGSGCALCGIL